MPARVAAAEVAQRALTWIKGVARHDWALARCMLLSWRSPGTWRVTGRLARPGLEYWWVCASAHPADGICDMDQMKFSTYSASAQEYVGSLKSRRARTASGGTGLSGARGRLHRRAQWGGLVKANLTNMGHSRSEVGARHAGIVFEAGWAARGGDSYGAAAARQAAADEEESCSSVRGVRQVRTAGTESRRSAEEQNQRGAAYGSIDKVQWWGGGCHCEHATGDGSRRRGGNGGMQQV